jgi:hypothetical protein
MRTALPKLLAAAMLLAAPMAAHAQTGSAAVPGINGPLVLPNGSGTVTYQSSGGTSLGNGVTVFHGTGRTETITFGSTPGSAGR